MSNQWPDFSKKIPQHKTVRAVIIEEGAGISERTSGNITFDVQSRPEGKGGFVHDCYLVVPKVAYRYPFFRVVQDGLDYPVTVHADVWPKGAAAANQEELRKDLGLVFRSDVTEKVVLQLLDLLS